MHAREATFGDECPCSGCQPAPRRVFTAEGEAEIERQIDVQTRLLELAQQNGIECVVREVEGVGRLWFVPREWRAIVGCMAAVVR